MSNPTPTWTNKETRYRKLAQSVLEDAGFVNDIVSEAADELTRLTRRERPVGSVRPLISANRCSP
jgi:hypothetical protein